MTSLQHTFSSIFRYGKNVYTLSQFAIEAIQKIEASLIDKNGKPYGCPH